MQQQLPALKLFRPRRFAGPWFIAIAAVVLFSMGCSPQIGDACEHDENCPSGSFCDRSVENGFCTITDCRIGECPSESVCVEYARHEAFCMRSCEVDDDCRGDHECIDDTELDKRYCFISD